MLKKMFGTLYVVATPIGNFNDITLRALETLKIVARIIAEDTRHASKLLNHFSIKKPMISLHDFNEHKKIDEIQSMLMAGESLALISDAGTPLISDPGFQLVRALKIAELSVVPIPGPSALIAALSVSGLPTDKFIFEGFLSSRPKAMEMRLDFLKSEQRTLIFYLSPHHVVNTLIAMKEAFGGDRQVVFARELTKIYETVLYTNVDQLINTVKSDKNQQKGEMVLLVHGNQKIHAKIEINPFELMSLLLADLPIKKAAAISSKITKVSKNELYQWAIDQQKTTN